MQSHRMKKFLLTGGNLNRQGYKIAWLFPPQEGPAKQQTERRHFEKEIE